MIRKISAFPAVAYLAVTGFFRGLRKDDRGLSGVVVAVMLILIAVLLIVMLWGSLSGWLGELWTRITQGESGIDGGSSF